MTLHGALRSFSLYLICNMNTFRKKVLTLLGALRSILLSFELKPDYFQGK